MENSPKFFLGQVESSGSRSCFVRKGREERHPVYQDAGAALVKQPIKGRKEFYFEKS